MRYVKPRIVILIPGLTMFLSKRRLKRDASSMEEMGWVFHFVFLRCLVEVKKTNTQVS
jgi:hypothetical protein